MTQHSVIYTGGDCTFTVHDEGEPFVATATAVVTSSGWGITVGLHLSAPEAFAYWHSSNTCDLITAWRVCQMLPRVKALRNQGGGYDTTLCGLVIGLQGDRNDRRMRERAQDLDITVDDLKALLRDYSDRWPTVAELCTMWDKLPAKQQESLVPGLRQAIGMGKVSSSASLATRLSGAERRIRATVAQKEREDALIAAGLEPQVSLRQLLVDLGVRNLADPIGNQILNGPAHFDFADLDRVIMRELIGSRAVRPYVALIATERGPDDSHHAFMGGVPGMVMVGVDYGQGGCPRVVIGDETLDLLSVRWDQGTEHFVLTLRPYDADTDDDRRDMFMTVELLRRQIGIDLDLDGPLPVGVTPSWLSRPTVRRRLQAPAS